MDRLLVLVLVTAVLSACAAPGGVGSLLFPPKPVFCNPQYNIQTNCVPPADSPPSPGEVRAQMKQEQIMARELALRSSRIADLSRLLSQTDVFG